MWSRILLAIAALFGLAGFLRMPSLDTVILAFPVLLVIAISLEEAWEWLTKSQKDPGPRCPQCEYDVRATPIQCPECGFMVQQSPDEPVSSQSIML